MLDIPFFIKVKFVIIALLGRMDQCCSKLKISGAGPGKKYFEPALQQYQYSGTTSGKPRYTIQTGTKRCDLVNVREQYQKRITEHYTGMDTESISYRYGKDAERKFWKVII